MHKKKILVVDDHRDIRDLLSEILIDEGYEVEGAADFVSAQHALDNLKFNIVISDIWLEGSENDGMELLSHIVSNFPTVPVLMISGHGNIETAITAVRKGAYDFIEKPFQEEKLLLLIKRAIEQSQLVRENSELKKSRFIADELIGTSGVIKKLKQSVEVVAKTKSRVLITGGSGTGKGVLARMLHKYSSYSMGEFYMLPAAYMMVEELYRHISILNKMLEDDVKGVTLFVDELGEMPMDTQEHLLRFIQSSIDGDLGKIRIISSISSSAAELIKRGKLNESLFYRLSVVTLNQPSLSERVEDIASLINYYQKNILQRERMLSFSNEAMRALSHYSWPGNVNQLFNTIEWLCIMTKGRVVELEDLPQEVLNVTKNSNDNFSSEIMLKDLRDARLMFEKDYICNQLKKFDYNITKTASFIGMDRASLHRKIKDLDIRIYSNDKP